MTVISPRIPTNSAADANVMSDTGIVTLMSVRRREAASCFTGVDHFGLDFDKTRATRGYLQFQHLAGRRWRP
jgi:hypothetical protein